MSLKRYSLVSNQPAQATRHFHRTSPDARPSETRRKKPGRTFKKRRRPISKPCARLANRYQNRACPLITLKSLLSLALSYPYLSESS